MKRTLALAIVLLAAHPASARVEASGTLQVSGLHAEDARLAGPLVAFLQEGGGAGEFTLHARELRVETDQAEPVLHLARVQDVRANESTRTQTFLDATVQGVRFLPQYRWDVFSTDPAHPARVQAEAECAQAVRAPERIERVPRVAAFGRPATVREAAGNLSWRCLAGGSLTVTGDFVLSLWSTDALLTAGDESRELRSGPQEMRPAPVAFAGYASRDVELYLFAADATLVVPALRDDETTLYTGAAQVAAGRMQLQGARGALALDGEPQAIAPSTVLLDDARAGLARPDAGSMLAVIDGPVSGLSIDGVAVSATGPPPRSDLWWLAAATAGLAALALLARQSWLTGQYRRFATQHAGGSLTTPRTWRERRGAGFWALAFRELRTGSPERAARHAERSRRLFPRSVDALLLRGALFQREGRLAPALACFEQASARVELAGDRAALSCHVASLLVAMHKDEALRDPGLAGHRLDQAVAWLRRAADADVETFEAAVRGAAFDALAQDPWVDGARAGVVRQDRARGLDLGPGAGLGG